MDISFSAAVHCLDGLVGHPITTVTNPTTKAVTHLVVAEDTAPYAKRLVPIEMIKKATPHLITLNCTKEGFLHIEQLEKLLVHPKDGHITHLVLKMGQVLA